LSERKLPDVFGRNSKGLAVDLTLNAIGAMSGTAPEERDLLIRTEKADDDGVRVAVVDSGPELPPARFEHLFEPFLHNQGGRPGDQTVDMLFDHRNSRRSIADQRKRAARRCFPVHAVQ